jgi:hypothetical protein
MKQILHFLNEADFQNFTAQLFSEEFPSFQAIEGAGGDGGLDGIEGETAYQMFFPEEKNRKKVKYIAKIDKDLAKLIVTIDKHKLTINRWIFVIPEDLYYEVVLHLQKKSKEIGIECLYWGATRLTALVNKHPHIKNAFPGIFLTDLKVDMERVSDGISELSRRAASSTTDILKEDDFIAEMQRINSQMQDERHSVMSRFGNTSVPQVASVAIQKKHLPIIDELNRRKQASDKMHGLELREINMQFDELVEKKNGEHVGRGTFHSGFREQDIQKIEEKRAIELQKIAVRYGKSLESNQPDNAGESAQQSSGLNFEPYQLLAMKVLAKMSDPKELLAGKTMSGSLIHALGDTREVGEPMKEFNDANPAEMLANLDELVGKDILTTRYNKSGEPIYKLTGTGFRVIRDDPRLNGSQDSQ